MICCMGIGLPPQRKVSELRGVYQELWMKNSGAGLLSSDF